MAWNEEIPQGDFTQKIPVSNDWFDYNFGNADKSAAKQQASENAMDRAFNAQQAAIGRAFDYTIFNESNAFNALEAQKNRDYQERMSNTSYQRAKADMQAAGLNPYLAYGQGGASSPSGSTANAGSASAKTASHSGSAHSSHNQDVLSLIVNSALSLATAGLSAKAQMSVNSAKAAYYRKRSK